MSVAVASKGSGAKGFVRGKGVTGLAWVSFGFAVIGGAALMSSGPGRLFAGFVGLFPDWVASLALLAGVITLVIDLGMDGTPNRAAIWCAILMPSTALAVNGKLGANVRELADRITAVAVARLGEWIGQGSTWVVAAAGITAALLIARRVVRKGGA